MEVFKIMTDEEYKRMLKLYAKVEKMINKYIDQLLEEENIDIPIMIPPEIYDEMCYEMGTTEIGLMGIS